jgi:hypothetical protein
MYAISGGGKVGGGEEEGVRFASLASAGLGLLETPSRLFLRDFVVEPSRSSESSSESLSRILGRFFTLASLLDAAATAFLVAEVLFFSVFELPLVIQGSFLAIEFAYQDGRHVKTGKKDDVETRGINSEHETERRWM